MRKRKGKPDVKWIEGTVDTDDDHIKIVYGDNRRPAAHLGSNVAITVFEW